MSMGKVGQEEQPGAEMTGRAALPGLVLQALQQPILTCGGDGCIIWANHAAETFFAASMPVLLRHRLKDLFATGSPVLELADFVARHGTPRTEYRVIAKPLRSQSEHEADVFAAPVHEVEGAVALLFQVRTMADKIDRQLVSRGAARSASGLAAMLSHEIKNPLSGIRGAAQLLEQTVGGEEQQLTRLIRDETDRIVKLVDRVEILGDARPVEPVPVNIHEILDRVALLVRSSTGERVRFVKQYDPSLPHVSGDRDQLVQVFLNLMKNAAESLLGHTISSPTVTISTAYRPGIRMSVSGAQAKVPLPLEITIRDNGPGVPENIRSILFDPFVTGKPEGTGLGLALVARIISDHGGIVECQSRPQDTRFSVLLPMARAVAARSSDPEGGEQ